MSLSEPPGEFPFVVCWDRAARPRVLDTDALRVLPEVFEATHSPSFLHEEGVAAGAFLRLPEDAYVTGFLTHEDPRPLDLVVGGSGTGKSHLIRWLAHEALRRNRSSGDRWWVVLVPRSSANLAEVVRCILRGFTGEVVGRLQGELDRAARPMSAEEARRRVLNELELVLRRDTSSLPPEERELASDLPDLLRDPTVSRRLVRPDDGILARMAAHFFGQRQNVADVDPARLRWRQEDLRLTPLETQRAALDVRELANQLMNDEQERVDAAAILNRMSGALGGLLGLRRGDLTQALKEIRKELLRSGRELVLMLEDLSVSHGLDAELLEALIVGDRDGNEPLCRMRAVVGLTGEDHGNLRDNILGRVRKTVLCNVPVTDVDGGTSSGMSRDDLVAFAARYLNGARYSLTELQEWSQDQKDVQQPLPSYCTRVRCPNLSTCHAAFGSVSISGEVYGLYPFTPELLLRLYRQATRQAPGTRSDRFASFNPRRLVGGVLNEVLDQAERTLPERHFPPLHLIEEFGLGAVDIAVRRRLEGRHRTDTGGRLINALELYSPDPAAGDPRLPPGIAESFGLPVLMPAESAQSGSNQPVSSSQSDSPTPRPSEVFVPSQSDETKPDPFTAWVSGAPVDDGTLNVWRALVYDAISAAIDWDTEAGLAPLSGQFMARYIHFEGQFVRSLPNPIELRITRSTEAGLALRTLHALRTEATSGNSADAEEALIDLWQWIQVRAEEVRRQLRPLADTGPASPTALEFAARLLMVGAVLRGRVKSSLSAAKALAQSVEPWPPEEAEPAERSAAWRSLWNAFHRHAESVRTWFLDALACPKGGETRAHILDPSAVLRVLGEALCQDVIAELPAGADHWPSDCRLKELGRDARDRMTAALAAEKQACASWVTEITGLLGGHSPEELAAAFEPTFREAAAQGRLLGEGALELSAMCQALPHRELIGLLDEARQAIALDSGGLFVALAALDRQRMREYLAFLNLTSQVLDQSLAVLEQGASGMSEAAGLSEEISALVNQLQEHLNVLTR